jgi:hypothetical protein
MNLIDTNIILELLLAREKVGEVKRFFEVVGYDNISLSKFSLYSIGIFLHRLNMDKVFREFIKDFIDRGGVRVFEIQPKELPEVLRIARKFKLDFDDAYQYAVAEKYDLQIISFDKNFDGTERGRSEPGDMIK